MFTEISTNGTLDISIMLNSVRIFFILVDSQLISIELYVKYYLEEYKSIY